MIGSAARVVRRVRWGVADQALSSLTNFAVGVVVARLLGTADFGAFSLAFGAYLIALNASRAMATEPLAMRFSQRTPDEWRDGTRAATGIALVLSVAIGVICALVGVVAPAAVGDAFLALAATLPGLLLQDSLRLSFFAAHRGAAATLNDLVWALALVPAFGLVIATGNATVLWVTIAWGASAAVAAAVGMVQARVVVHPLLARTWWRDHKDVIVPLLGEFMVTSGAGQAALFLIGGIAGLAAAGTFRAGELILGPVRIVFMGTHLVAIPEAVRLYHRAPDRLFRACQLIAAVLVATALITGAVVRSLPDAVGQAVLGETWAPARAVIIPIAIFMAGSGAVAGALIGLRGIGAARRSFRARLVMSVATLTLASAGAATGGAVGAAWGTAVAIWIGVLLWWRELRAALAEPAAGASTAEDPRTLASPVQIEREPNA